MPTPHSFPASRWPIRHILYPVGRVKMLARAGSPDVEHRHGDVEGELVDLFSDVGHEGGAGPTPNEHDSEDGYPA